MKTSTQQQSSTLIRLDKWLWAARFYKTRAKAREMILGGKVFYNGQRSKPSKHVEVGAQLKLRQGNEDREVIIEQLSDQRRGAPEAQLLYRETEASLRQREQNAEARRLKVLDNPRPERRPDKKQRRQIIGFKNQ